MITSHQEPPATDTQSGASGTISQLFATPVARITHPHAEQFNESLAAVLLARSQAVDNTFAYKSETSADMARWGEPLVDRLSAWMLRMARQYVESVIGRDLDDAVSEGHFNSATGQQVRHTVSVAIGTSWASIYRHDDRHEAHFHPNTALAAIYYVKAPGSCELDLIDPRPNIGYFDPGITFAGDDHNVRLKCAPGELVIFPGWLKHSVPPFREEGERISMSWNLSYVIDRIPGEP